MEQHTDPTQSRAAVSQGLHGVREAARRDKGLRFTALLHHVNERLLRDSFRLLKKEAAPGVDRMTWSEYEQGVEERIADLHDRVHRGAYRAQPSRRVYIPKPDGRQRPLGIAALEDKIVQQAVATVLNQIYEEDFLGFSYGFRPGRGAHDALDALTVGIMTKKVGWILDADIRGFFDNISHERLIELMEVRITDQRIIRLIQKWLKAGVSEDGQWSETKIGTPDHRRSSMVSLVQDKVSLWSAPVARGDLAVAGEHLSALRARPMGDGVAQEERVRRYDHRPICGRLCAWVSTPEGGRAVSGATAETAGELRAGTSLGQDTPDSVRAVRGGRPETGREGETGNVRFSGVHPHLRHDP